MNKNERFFCGNIFFRCRLQSFRARFVGDLRRLAPLRQPFADSLKAGKISPSG